MKRRQVITAIGTLAVGSGAALGTGAVSSVTNVNQDSSFRVVAPGANIAIAPVDSGNGNVVVDPDSNDAIVGNDENSPGSIDWDKLEFGDLPLVYVKESDGMVTIEVAVERGTAPEDLGNVFTVTNNSTTTDYDIGFQYTGYGTGVTGTEISELTAQEAFQLRETAAGVVSPDWGAQGNAAANTIPLYHQGNSDGSSSKTVSLYADVTVGNITSELSTDGTLGDNYQSQSWTLIDEVTSVATER